jgi:methionyl-tRNA formyltransferase
MAHSKPLTLRAKVCPMKPRVAFFGSPAFALPVLEAILAHFEVVLIVAQPDKPAGRGLKLTPPPVAAYAKTLGIALEQPNKLKNNQAFAQTLRQCGADVAVTCAYGKILPQHILEVPKFGFLNVHTSLLPKYRGAAPIQWAIIDGQTHTGVTIMQTDIGMDTGDIALVGQLEIGADETALELAPRLSQMGAELIVQALSNLEHLTFTKQDHAHATHARMLEKHDGEVNWNLPTKILYNQFRGHIGWPGTFTHLNGKLLKIHAMRPATGSGTAGTVLRLETGVVVATGDSALELLEVQPEGKPKMAALEWAKNFQIRVGTGFEVPKREES